MSYEEEDTCISYEEVRRKHACHMAVVDAEEAAPEAK
jgi:hypothetical protein